MPPNSNVQKSRGHEGQIKGDSCVEYSEIKGKYFIIVEGADRAIIRDSEAQAEKTRRRLLKHSGGKRIYIYKSNQKNG